MINVEIKKHKLSKEVLDCDKEAVEALQEDLEKRIFICINRSTASLSKLGYCAINGEIVKKFKGVSTGEPEGFVLKEHHEAGLKGMKASGDLYGE